MAGSLAAFKSFKTGSFRAGSLAVFKILESGSFKAGPLNLAHLG